MERKQTFEFDEEEINVIKEALAMYHSYQKEMVLPMLMGDESDIKEINVHAATTESLFYEFFELDNDESWEEESMNFQEVHDRPMDVNDVSKFDWHDHKYE